MIITQFINDKITQISAYIIAVYNNSLHYTELDNFITYSLEEWAVLKVTDEMPGSCQERVFWHIIHEISLHGAQALRTDMSFKKGIDDCLAFFTGTGTYPLNCIGWRLLP